MLFFRNYTTLQSFFVGLGTAQPRTPRSSEGQ